MISVLDFLYYDDLELCNPLGSRRTIHKIGIRKLHGTSVSEITLVF